MPPSRSSAQERSPHPHTETRAAPELSHGAEKVQTPRMRRQRPGQHRLMGVAADTRDVLLALEPRPESARLVRRALAGHGLHEDVAHTVTLLATEIVGNAVRHAGLRSDQRIVFFARLGEDFAHVEVADQGAGFDPDAVETEGFGLRLLEKLASRWDVDCSDRGCKVWFDVDRRSGRRFVRRG